MKIVVATDSFKGSLSSMEAGRAIEKGIKRVYPQCDIVIKPISDGGEGTIESLLECLHGTIRTIKVTGPLGDKIKCDYGLVTSRKLAIIEIAKIVGLTLVPKNQRNPLYTTTYGIGEVIKDAIENGCRKFIIGLGGSSTNDRGIGMLQALGFEMLDQDSKPVSLGAKGLSELDKIIVDKANPLLKGCQFMVACDVTNPLCGKLGASVIYGPQKGADSYLIKEMDKWLDNFAKLSIGSNQKYPGTGAAGGLGFASLTYLNARLESGIKLIIDEIGLENDIKDADLLITGEGQLDGQTTMGKAPIGVANLAKLYNLPVIAFTGSITSEAIKCHEAGIDAYFSILNKVTSIDEAMDRDTAINNLISTVEQVFKLWKIVK